MTATEAPCALLVETTWSDALRIDRQERVIRDVKILGRQSRNGRIYSDRAMAEAAALYEDCDVNIDHPAEGEAALSRKLADGFGVLRNVRVEGEAVFGDLLYFDEHPLAALVLERAERAPSGFGLSHNATGRLTHKGGQTVVESIERVLSVDLVRHPATSSGLFESAHQRSQEVIEELAALARRIEKLEHALAARRLLERMAIDPMDVDEVRFSELTAMSDAQSMAQAISAWPRSITHREPPPSIAALRRTASELQLTMLRSPGALARAIS